MAAAFLNEGEVFFDDAFVQFNAFRNDQGEGEPMAEGEVTFRFAEVVHDGPTVWEHPGEVDVVFGFDPSTFFDSPSFRQNMASEMLSRLPRLMYPAATRRFWQQRFSDYLYLAVRMAPERIRFFFEVRLHTWHSEHCNDVEEEEEEAAEMIDDDVEDVESEEEVEMMEDVQSEDYDEHVELIDVLYDLDTEFQEEEEEGIMREEEFGGVPASPSAIEKLERRKYDDGRWASSAGGVGTTGSGECCICMDTMESEEMDITRMPCFHVFHHHCLTQWLENSHLCPLCRYEMPPSTLQC